MLLYCCYLDIMLTLTFFYKPTAHLSNGLFIYALSLSLVVSVLIPVSADNQRLYSGELAGFNNHSDWPSPSYRSLGLRKVRRVNLELAFKGKN